MLPKNRKATNHIHGFLILLRTASETAKTQTNRHKAKPIPISTLFGKKPEL